VNGQLFGGKRRAQRAHLALEKTMFCDFLGKHVWTGLRRGYGDSRLITFWAFMSERICIILSSHLWLDSLFGRDDLFFGPE
jgi:hypothetical protein